MRRAKKRAAVKPQRFDLLLGPNSARALQELQRTLEASSRADVVRLALQTLAKLVKESMRGARILIREADGSTIEVILPLIGDGGERGES